MKQLVYKIGEEIEELSETVTMLAELMNLPFVFVCQVTDEEFVSHYTFCLWDTEAEMKCKVLLATEFKENVVSGDLEKLHMSSRFSSLYYGSQTIKDVSCSGSYYIILADQVERKINSSERLFLRQCSSELGYLINKAVQPEKSELQISEETYRILFNHSPVGIFHYNKELVVTNLNDRFSQLLKSPHNQLIGFDMHLLEDSRIIPVLEIPMCGDEGFYEGEFFISGSQQIHFIQLHTAPVFDRTNKLNGAVGIIVDVTDKFKSEVALREKETKYRDLVENINDTIFSLNKQGFLSYISPMIKQLTGYRPDQLMNKHFAAYIHPEDLQKVNQVLFEIRSGKTYTFEHRLFKADETFRWVRTSVRPVIVDNRLDGIHGVTQDIEEIKTAIDKLRENEERFRLVAMHTNDIIYEWDIKTDGLVWHRRSEFFKSESRHSKTLKEFITRIYPDDRGLIIRKWNKSILTRKPWNGEFRIEWGKNSYRFFKGSGIVQFKNGEPSKGFGSLTDVTMEKELITHLKEAKKLAESNHEKVQSLLSVIPDNIFVFDAQGVICDYRTENTDELYMAPNEFINKKVDDILPPGIAALTHEKISKVLAAKGIETYDYELIINQRTMIFESRMVYLSADRTLAIVRDVTKAKEDERALISAKAKAEESDRLKSAFLANMSHEIRTPMNGIIGFSELLRNPDVSNEERTEYTNVILRSGQQLLNIINDVLEISKIETEQMELNWQVFSVNELLADLFAFFAPLSQLEGVEILIEGDTLQEEVSVTADRQKLHQIFNNLISNAFKFTIVGSVRFGCMVKADGIEFFVKDSGVGIDPKDHEYIFERFGQAEQQLNQQYGGGTGLGLSISKSLIEIMGGTISVQSRLGEGACFVFMIPIKQ
ncbi:MAG: PAS domain S-box protein [Marinilabiliaceae bacterium]|nr:PAS domain S-box protein [Marinilabiliaceae bacterium]